MFEILQSIDQRLLHVINSHGGVPLLDGLMVFVTDFGLWKWPLLITSALLLILGGYRERLLIVMTISLVLVGEGVNGTIKRIVNRPRPYQHLEHIRQVDRNGVRYSKPGPVDKGRSMPSSHVANNVAFAFMMTVLYRRWGRLTWLVTLAVGYSRVYIGSHYPSDVVVAMILSVCYSVATTWAAQRLWQRFAPRWLAAAYAHHPDLFPVTTDLT